MTTVDVDLPKNPELAELVSDKQPGDWIMLKASIKARDSQTVKLRLEECDDCEKPETDGDEEEEAVASEEPAPAPAEQEKPSKKLARQLTSQSTDML